MFCLSHTNYHGFIIVSYEYAEEQAKPAHRHRVPHEPATTFIRSVYLDYTYYINILEDVYLDYTYYINILEDAYGC